MKGDAAGIAEVVALVLEEPAMVTRATGYADRNDRSDNGQPYVTQHVHLCEDLSLFGLMADDVTGLIGDEQALAGIQQHQPIAPRIGDDDTAPDLNIERRYGTVPPASTKRAVAASTDSTLRSISCPCSSVCSTISVSVSGIRSPADRSLRHTSS